jgi:uncharacterized membrane protein
MERILFILILASALGSGLIGGVFFAFSTFVMQALGRIPAAQGIAAMQSINVVVLNPWFLGVFVGTAASCTLVVIAALMRQPAGTVLLIAGCVLYVAGTFLVTMMFNVPRNDALMAVAPESAEGAAYWSKYLVEWTFWNHVRTAAATAGSAALILALVQQASAESL